ncbi:MAG TPA: NAD-dependent epimerase/dehydratase family protein, partial [Gemmatimonadaceae bacterium]|nr:NAD-dependent epimerase/dehydratase family protein [Gemmatimonadaceae bacterium]
MPVSERSPTVLVTGGAGYIGSVLVRQLLAGGWRVRVLDSLRAGGESLA